MASALATRRCAKWQCARRRAVLIMTVTSSVVESVDEKVALECVLVSRMDGQTISRARMLVVVALVQSSRCS